MAYKIPWSNFHELNLDWLLEQVKQLREDVNSLIGSATPSTSIPEMDGVGSSGTEAKYARGDHRHPTDTSRAAQSDLTQEITDRGNADLALAGDIADVDAKIKFSSAAPIMDSTSASAGFSDFMARADHIHPTDTSRASAEDVATLTARMDGFAGSANPSDATPQMDGVGAPGTGGNYSRGDHVHPSDTSKLDKAGGTITGDLTVKGVLTPEKQQAYMDTSATGWIRVATIPRVEGTKVTIQIVRKGTLVPAEMHIIDLSILQNSLSFLNEASACDVLYVNKIRYTDAGALDIHMDQAYPSNIAVYITPYAPTKAAQDAITTITPQGVADAPVGETILTTHKFTDTTYHNQCSITRVANNYFDDSAVSRLAAYTQNDTLYLKLWLRPSTSIPSNTDYVNIADISLPTNRKLVSQVYIMIPGGAVDGHLSVSLTANGTIGVANYSADGSGTSNFITTMAFPLIEA